MHLVPFGCLTKLGAKRAELVQKFVPWSRARIFRNEHTQSTPLDSKLMFHSASYYFGAFGTVRLRYKTQFKTGQTDAKVRAMKSRGNFSQQRNRSTPLDSKVLVCIVLFGCIWDRLVALQNAVQNGPKWCKSLCHEVASEFFAMNTPDPPHWTLNSCFGVFCTIWMHFGPFGCCTKLGAKPAEVVQKFVPRSRVIIFRNKHTGLTSLGPKVMFWCVSYYLRAFATVWLPNKTGCKTAWSGAKVRAMKSCQNFSQQTIRSSPLDPNLMFRRISYYLDAFGRV